jgi:hypothetical protein
MDAPIADHEFEASDSMGFRAVTESWPAMAGPVCKVCGNLADQHTS